MERLIFNRLVPEIFSRPFMQPLNRLLLRIAISGLGGNNFNAGSIDERRFLQRLRKRLPGPVTILDVGANAGQYARLLRSCFPAATIYSFEPNPVAFEKLQETAKELSIRPIPLGCGASSGRVELFDVASTPGSSLATTVPGALEVDGLSTTSRTIELTTIDDFCRDIAEISLLKIDVEGAEADVLRGARQTLDRTRFVQIEFSERNVVSHTTMDDLEALLPGFDLHRILFDGNLLPLAGAPAFRRNIYTYQNLIAVNRSLQPEDNH